MEEETEREVNDFYFRQLCKVRVSPGVTFINERVNHVAVSNQYGLIFAVALNDIKVIHINEIEKHSSGSVKTVVTSFNHQVIKIGFPIQQICLSCDESTLIIVYRDEKVLNIGVVDIKILNEQNQSEPIFAMTCISQSPDVYVKDMRVHPDTPTLTAICLSNGHVLILELSDVVLKTVSMLTKKENACSISWSPKGKRIAIGQNDGKLVQYDKSLKEEKKITVCNLFEGEIKSVSGLYWLSSFQFFVVYASVNVAGSSTAAIVTVPNNDPPIFHLLEDIYFGFNNERLLYYYFSYLSEWQLMITMSSNNMEAVPVGNIEKKWCRWILQDFGRAEVPLSDKNEDAFAVGVGISLNSKLTIQQDDKEIPASPVFFMLSTDGVLCAYQMVNQFSGTNYQIVNPPKFVPQGAAKQGNISKVSSKSPHINFWSQQTSLNPVNNFGSVTTLSSPFNKNTNFSVPPSTTANSLSVSFDFTGGKSSAPEQKTLNLNKNTSTLGPLVSTTGSSFSYNDKLSVESKSSNDISRKVSGKKQANVSFNLATSSTDQVASIPTVPFSFSLQNNSSSSENFTLVSSATSAPFTSRVETMPSTPVSQNKQLKSFQFTSDSFDKKPSTDQIEKSKNSFISNNSKLAYDDMEIKIYSDKLESALQKNISEELKSFNNEMEKFLNSVSDINNHKDLIGTQIELQQIRKSVEDVEHLVNKYKSCMAENKKESCELRNILLINFKNADDAKLQKEKMEDKRFSIILKSRPLDPVSSRQQKIIRDQMNEITERIIDVNIALDEEWKKIEMKKRNIHNKNSSILQNQQVYKTVDAIDQIASNLSNRLKTLKMKSESNDLLLISKNQTLHEDSANEKKLSYNFNNSNLTSQTKNISHLRNYLSRRSKTPLHKSKLCNALLPDDLSNTACMSLNENIYPKAASTPFFAIDNSKQIVTSVSAVLEEKYENKFNSPKACVPDNQKNNSTLIVTKKLFVESPTATSSSPIATKLTLEKHENQKENLVASAKLVSASVQNKNELFLKTFDTKKPDISSSNTTFVNKLNVFTTFNTLETTVSDRIFKSSSSTSNTSSVLGSGLFVSTPVSSDESIESLSTTKELSSNKTNFKQNTNSTFFSNEQVSSSVKVVPSVNSATTAPKSFLGNTIASTNLESFGSTKVLPAFSGFGLSNKITEVSTNSTGGTLFVSSTNGLSASTSNSSLLSTTNMATSFSSNDPSISGLFAFMVKTESPASSIVSNSAITSVSGLSTTSISAETANSFFVTNPASTSSLFGSNVPLFSFTSSAGNTGSLFSSNATSISGGLFGSNVSSTDNILATSAAKTVSSGNLFSSNATTTSLFGSNISTTSNIPVGLSSAKVVTTVSSGSLFSFTATTTLGGGLFGSNVPSATTSNTTQSGLFGSSIPSAAGVLSASSVTTASSGSLFSSNTAATVSGGLFGSNSTSINGLFSATAVTSVSSSSFFSSNTATTSTGGLFGSITSSTNSLFGSSTGTSSSGLFSFNAATTCSSGGLFSSTTSKDSIGGLFGSNPNVTSSGGLFSNLAGSSGGFFSSPTKSSFFGSANSSTNATSVSGGLFGSSNQSSGLFNTPTSDSKGFFSTPSSQNNIFGSKTSESLDSSMSNKGDVGTFGGFGLGGKPMSDPNKNPFGVVTSTSVQSSNIFGNSSGSSGSNIFGSASSGASSGANIFGNSSGSSGASLFGQSSNQATGSFSKGFGTGFTQVQPSVFGSPPSSAPIFGAAAPSFGGNPVFGSPQQTTNMFGGPPSFGSGATFGGAPSFGSSVGVFGGGSTNAPTFGNLASHTGTPSFASLGSSAQPFGQPGSVFGSAPVQTTSPQFSSWR
ncbi:nuclear pore complex protein Nup214 isoform X1 [Hydra vulgaris]|uniref:nuclear pore complex protein Nup214 isoform X1 n=1 Tax=Hydra vulgaris TaxID=6087 RepID=UPI001F5E4893|nr:nuclear pore complex protein Nup214 [Hydra vulgaris]